MICKKNVKLILFAVFLLASVAGLAACRASEPDIVVEDAWGRQSPSMATTGAFYMNIINKGGSDRLVGVATDACGAVELHESVMDDNGVMSMHPLENGIEIPAGKTVELKPGGMHVMCINKEVDFISGSEITLSLEFEKSGIIILGVAIREP